MHIVHAVCGDRGYKPGLCSHGTWAFFSAGKNRLSSPLWVINGNSDLCVLIGSGTSIRSTCHSLKHFHSILNFPCEGDETIASKEFPQ